MKRKGSPKALAKILSYLLDGKVCVGRTEASAQNLHAKTLSLPHPIFTNDSKDLCLT